MGEELDYTTLKWVKDEIQESLNQTSQALETFVENPGDTTQIRFCATYLHQVYGTLQMVEIYGGALLAEEMEKVANALLNDKVAQKDDAYEVLMRAILQLPSYLESLEHGQADMPMVLLPLLNDLRAARGENLLSENAFFAPDLTVAPPSAQLPPGKSYPDIQGYARKLRPVYQVSLLGWYRDKDAEGSLKKLAAVLRELQNASQTQAAARLWWVAGGVIEALIDGGLDTGVSLKLLMGQVDREIKRLIDKGENAIVANTPTELLKNCLYYVGSARSTGPRVGALKQAFRLEHLLPYAGDLDQAMDNLKGSNAALMENVSAVIKEDLLAVKDQLDIYVRNKDRQVSELEPMAANLRRIADTLAMLGLGDLRKVIQNQSQTIGGLVARNTSPDDATLMEIASSLLYVEASLDNLAAARRDHGEEEAPDLSMHEDETEVLLPKSEFIQIVNLVIGEVKELMAGIKEGFNTFAVEPTQFGPISEVPEKLEQIKGALAVMNMERASQLLDSAIAFIRHEMLDPKVPPDPVLLDTLADVITGVEYFLEAIEEGRRNPESILSGAEASVERLGYPLSKTSAAAQADVAREGGKPGEFLAKPPRAEAVDKPEQAAGWFLESAPEIASESRAEAAEPAFETPAPKIVAPEIAAPSASVAGTGAGEEVADEIEEDVDPEILEIFVEEADEVLGTMTDCLHAWRANPEDQKSLETLRRSYHTMKGSGRLAGAKILGDFAWAMENMLNRVLEGRIALSPVMFKLLDHAESTLRGLMAHLKGEAKRRPSNITHLAEQAFALADGAELSLDAIAGSAAVTIAPEAASAKEVLELPEPVIEKPAFAEPVFDVPEFAELAVAEPEEIAAEAEPLYDPVLVEVFRKETATHLATLRNYLDNCGGAAPYAITDPLQRALHTLHGSARMAHVESIAELSEPMDRYVRTLHDRDLALNDEGLAVLKAVTEEMAARAEDFDAPQAVTPDYSELLAQITNLRAQAQAQSAAAGPVAEKIETTGFNAEDFELIGIFVEEADEILRTIDDLLQRWRDDRGDISLLAELQRALHTIKGGARLANIKAVGDLTHGVETLLENIVEGRQSATGHLPDLVQACLDWLAGAIEQVRAGETVAPSADLLDRIERSKGGAEAFPALGAESVPELEIAVEEIPAFSAEPAAEELPVLAEEAAAAETEEFEETAFMAEEAVPVAEVEVPAVAAEYDVDLLDIFLEEAVELQETIEQILHRWSGNIAELKHVAELQRALHTLKGGARMANVMAVGDLAHVMESLLERVANGQMAPQAQFPDLIQTCHDWLDQALDKARQLQPVAAAGHLVGRIEALLRGEQAPVVVPEAAPVAEAAPVEAVAEASQAAPDLEEVEELGEVIPLRVPQKAVPAKPTAAVPADEQVRVRADLLNDLVNFSGEVNIYNSRIAQQLNVWHFNLAELDQTVKRLHEQLRKFEIETEAQIMYRHETTAGSVHAEDFDPLELDRFSTMQQLSRGMAESLGDLTSIQNLLANLSGETDVLLLQQQRVTSELQEGLTRTRMVAFSNILPRLRRIVRQTGTETGKQAELHVSGAEGELDRTQLNRLVPAMEHILRNAVDHGIETPAERTKAGKPAQGSIEIAFSHQGSEVVLVIRDDGKGIDIEALRKKAVEKGLMLADADLSDREVMEFIFASGFSTAKKVTQISGRGVGMDVVNTEIKQLGGYLHVDSVAGKGTTLTLRLPLTVLVNQALMVQVGDATYAIQLPNVEHVIRINGADLRRLAGGEQQKYDYAGNQYQYLNLSNMLTGAPMPLPEDKVRVPLLLVRSGDHRIALQVDTLLGRQEIVIKSVGPQLSTVSVLSGATILPNGEVALILDVGSLVRTALAQQHGKAEPLMAAPVAEARRTTVMIVDDSITVRKVTERLLRRYDYDIITAKDGVDALTVMLEQIPDIMLLDIEMPRMDGYELATTMRNDERMKRVPIIMITSRTGDKHRQRALDIGVNMYMGKPYHEQELIENIQSLVGAKA